MHSGNVSGQPSPMASAMPSGMESGGTASTSSAGTSANASTHGSTSQQHSAEMNMNDLQSLLLSLQNTQVAQQQDQQQYQQQVLQGGNLSISELEKLLADKERFEQLQNQQTAFLRQQLHTLQQQQRDMQIQHHQSSVPHTPTGGISTSNVPASGSMNAAQLMQQFEQMQSGHDDGQFGQGGNGAGQNLSQLHDILQQIKAGDGNTSALMAQLGVFTPASSTSSGGLSHARTKTDFMSPLDIPSGQSGLIEGQNMPYGQAFTPLESPAITPASVFSNASMASTSADILSPLTSPALRPQFDSMGLAMSPFYGPTLGRARSRIGASPAGPQPTKSVPRKNRSTTAEARANRARPSPLIKPVNNPMPASMQRKRTESVSGSSSSPHGSSMPSAQAARHARQSSEGGARVNKSADTTTNETGQSTPSPIEMPPPTGKPMTPSSIMGMKSKQAERSDSNGGSTPVASLRAVNSPQKVKDGESSKSVTFAETTQSPDGLANLLPGGLSKAERDAWASTMKSSGGLDSRRTSHKAAEQKRRDSLKYCFDDLRDMLPPIALDDDVPGGSMLGPDGLLEDQHDEMFALEEVGDAEGASVANRAISKVALLRHSNEYLIRLKLRLMRRDRDLAAMRRENLELRERLGLQAPANAAFWIGMGVGPSPQGDAKGLVDQYSRVHIQQQVQLQMQLGQMNQLNQMGPLDLGAPAFQAAGPSTSMPQAALNDTTAFSAKPSLGAMDTTA